MKKLKNALIGLAGLAATAVPNQDANAQFQREHSPHIQQKIEEIRTQHPLGNYEIRSSLITPLMIPNAPDSEEVEQKHQHDHDILKQRGASKEVIVKVDDNNNVNYTIPFTQGQDTLKLASINPESDAYVTLKDSQKFFEFTNEMGERERESLEHILTNGGSLLLPGDAKLKGKEGDLLYITGPDMEPSVSSYAIGRAPEKFDKESVRFALANLGHKSTAEFLADEQHKSDLTEEINNLYKKVDDKKERITDLEGTLGRAERIVSDQSDVIEKQGYFLNNWRVEPGVGIKVLDTSGANLGVNLKELSNYTIGLRATTPNRIGITAEYTPQKTTTENFQFEKREDLPSDRPISGEVVRKTNIEDITKSYTVAGGLDFPITNKANLGVMLGMQRNNFESNWTDNSYTLRNGQKYNEQQDNFTQTDSSRDLLVGVNVNAEISDVLSAYAQGMYNTESKDLGGTVGFRVNLTGGRK